MSRSRSRLTRVMTPLTRYTRNSSSRTRWFPAGPHREGIAFSAETVVSTTVSKRIPAAVGSVRLLTSVRLNAQPSASIADAAVRLHRHDAPRTDDTLLAYRLAIRNGGVRFESRCRIAIIWKQVMTSVRFIKDVEKRGELT